MELWQLRQMQSLPLEAKIIKTQLRIREWYDHWNGQVYISFSGGKDSTVLLDIARKIYPNIPAVFVDTGLEYPEIREFVKTIDNVVTVKPEMNFKQVIEKYGYPIISKEQSRNIHDMQNNPSQITINRLLHDPKRLRIAKKWQYLINAPFKISDQCCTHLKKKPIKIYEKETKNNPIMGTLALESKLRTRIYIENGGCNAFNNKRPISTPLGFWTEQDILQYFINYKLKYCAIYGDIIKTNGELTTTQEKRTGCMFCMFGVHLEQRPNRFERMKKTHPKLWNYCMNKLCVGQVLDYMGIEYGIHEQLSLV